jgi:phosphatidylserine/phosphatidylglycerophosphate/cardiolipin synthase-like enzyme
LVDAQPVGFEPEERRIRNGLLSLINASGASTHLATHGRIAYDHAKYAVVDGAVTMVQSENLVPTGIPLDVASGNRGWGVLVEDPEVAAYITHVFTTDDAVAPWRAEPWTLGPDEASQPPPVQETRPYGVPQHDALRVQGPMTVTPVISPDHTGGPDDPVLAALRSAQASIRVNQLQLPPVWADASGAVWPSAYVEALEDAAGRGVDVRVLVDGHFLDDPPASGGNQDTVARLNAAGLPNLEARIWGQDQFGVLHAKGFVVDGNTTLVGSMNWNLHSVTRNREVSLLIDGQGVGAYFATVFDTDWDRADPAALPLGTPAPSVAWSATVITFALFLAAVAYRRPL